MPKTYDRDYFDKLYRDPQHAVGSPAELRRKVAMVVAQAEYYLARPIRNEAECAPCHSTPSAAPRTLIARYGPSNGFGWQNNEIVGAQVVSVPFARATANADRAFRAVMISLITVFAAVFLVVNGVLYGLVVRPVRQIARVADRLSLGEISAEEFPQHGAEEVASVGRSFNRMRKSLEKAMRMLEK